MPWFPQLKQHEFREKFRREAPFTFSDPDPYKSLSKVLLLKDEVGEELWGPSAFCLFSSCCFGESRNRVSTGLALRPHVCVRVWDWGTPTHKPACPHAVFPLWVLGGASHQASGSHPLQHPASLTNTLHPAPPHARAPRFTGSTHLPPRVAGGQASPMSPLCAHQVHGWHPVYKFHSPGPGNPLSSGPTDSQRAGVCGVHGWQGAPRAQRGHHQRLCAPGSVLSTCVTRPSPYLRLPPQYQARAQWTPRHPSGPPHTSPRHPRASALLFTQPGSAPFPQVKVYLSVDTLSPRALSRPGLGCILRRSGGSSAPGLDPGPKACAEAGCTLGHTPPPCTHAHTLSTRAAP